MDMMTKFGGRKFLMALLAIGIATFLEVKTDKGLSVNMAGFLITVVGAFSVTNLAATGNFLKSRKPGADTEPLQSKLDQLHSTVEKAMDPELQKKFIDVLGNMHNDIKEVKGLTGQIGQTMINQSKR